MTLQRQLFPLRFAADLTVLCDHTTIRPDSPFAELSQHLADIMLFLTVSCMCCLDFEFENTSLELETLQICANVMWDGVKQLYCWILDVNGFKCGALKDFITRLLSDSTICKVICDGRKDMLVNLKYCSELALEKVQNLLDCQILFMDSLMPQTDTTFLKGLHFALGIIPTHGAALQAIKAMGTAMMQKAREDPERHGHLWRVQGKLTQLALRYCAVDVVGLWHTWAELTAKLSEAVWPWLGSVSKARIERYIAAPVNSSLRDWLHPYKVAINQGSATVSAFLLKRGIFPIRVGNLLIFTDEGDFQAVLENLLVPGQVYVPDDGVRVRRRVDDPALIVEAMDQADKCHTCAADLVIRGSGKCAMCEEDGAKWVCWDGCRYRLHDDCKARLEV